MAKSIVDRVTEIVQAFIAAHPELEPAKFGFPPDFPPHQFFLAASVILSHMRQCARLLSDRGAVLTLREDGTVLLDGQTLIDAEMIKSEVAWHTDCWVNAGSAGTMHDPVIVPALIRWLVAAVIAKPDLLRGYVMTGCSGSEPRSVALTPIPTSANDDSLDYWRV